MLGSAWDTGFGVSGSEFRLMMFNVLRASVSAMSAKTSENNQEEFGPSERYLNVKVAIGSLSMSVVSQILGSFTDLASPRLLECQ